MEPDLIKNSVPSQTCDDYDYGSNFKKLKVTDNVRELQTVLRDKTTSRSDFVFYADRLIRLVVEEGLNQLPYKNCEVTTPTGYPYQGLRYEKGNCCVSIMRSGEAMEQGLRDCCRSIRIGKILVHTDEETHDAKVVYAKLPPDIANRKVLLMYPIMSTGNTVMKAVNILKEHKVPEENIILLNLFITPAGLCVNPCSLGVVYDAAVIQYLPNTGVSDYLYIKLIKESKQERLLHLIDKTLLVSALNFDEWLILGLMAISTVFQLFLKDEKMGKCMMRMKYPAAKQTKPG